MRINREWERELERRYVYICDAAGICMWKNREREILYVVHASHNERLKRRVKSQICCYADDDDDDTAVNAPVKQNDAGLSICTKMNAHMHKF